MDHERLLDVLKQENALLRERVQQLEAILLDTNPLPIEWSLTASEARVFGALVTREIATKEAVMAALYCDRLDADAEIEPKIVDVFICKIRKKITPFGVTVQTIWGRGWSIDAATRDRFRKNPTRTAA